MLPYKRRYRKCHRFRQFRLPLARSSRNDELRRGFLCTFLSPCSLHLVTAICFRLSVIGRLFYKKEEKNLTFYKNPRKMGGYARAREDAPMALSALYQAVSFVFSPPIFLCQRLLLLPKKTPKHLLLLRCRFRPRW